MDNVFLPYLDQVTRAVETGWFDVIGHLDLPKRYAPKTHRDYDPARYGERLEPIFDAMIERGVGFEINTSGLRQTPRSEEHTSELQSRQYLVCRLLLEKKKTQLHHPA